MKLTRAARSPLRLSFISASVTAMLVALVAFAPAVAGADTEGGILVAASDQPLILGDLAAVELFGGKEFLGGVVWQDRGVSYVRYTDGLWGLQPAEPLRGGFRATDPRVAVCSGDALFAASVWKSAAGGNIGIDHIKPGDGHRRFVLAAGHTPDIACRLGIVAVTYMSGELARLAIFDGEGCANPCTPEFQYNLGAAPEFGRATVAATDRGFVVSWMGPGVYVQRFLASWGAGGIPNVTVKPLITVGQDSWYPQIASDGQRVVIAYGRRGQTHMRISENRGRTFGSRIVVSKYCLNCPEGSSSPDSVDVRDGRIMVHVGRGGGTPTAIDQVRFLTSNDGKTWTKTSVGEGGDAYGVLLDNTLAEAWDNHVYAGSIYGNQPQEIWFRTDDLP